MPLTPDHVPSNLCKDCKKEPRMGSLQSRCIKCQKSRLRAKEQAKKERLKIKRLKHKERPAALKKKLDIIFSKYIRLRDKGNPCVTCGAPWEFNHQNGHFISRRHFATRWDEINAHSQCPKCNLWGAGEQFAHANAIDLMYGKGTAQSIADCSHGIFKPTTEFLKEKIAYYEAKTQALEEMQSVR